MCAFTGGGTWFHNERCVRRWGRDMGQSHIQQNYSAVSVDGFDQIYQPQSAEALGAPELAQRDPVPQIQPDPTEGVALEDAAKILALHIDTVRKRLQKGKLRGFKVADKFGEKWFVHKDELTKAQRTQAHPSPEARIAPDVLEAIPVELDAEIQADPPQAQPNPVPDVDKAQGDPIVDLMLDPDHSQDTQSKGVRENDVEYKRLMQIIESQAHQLKAAGDVIMYLRSEVDEAKTQVKLLTDSRHKDSLLSKVKRWFFGESGIKGSDS